MDTLWARLCAAYQVLVGEVASPKSKQLHGFPCPEPYVHPEPYVPAPVGNVTTSTEPLPELPSRWPSKEDALWRWPLQEQVIPPNIVLPVWFLDPQSAMKDFFPGQEYLLVSAWAREGVVLPENRRVSYLVETFLRLLSWPEARPILMEWFTRCIVLADKTADPEANAALLRLSALAEGNPSERTYWGYGGGGFGFGHAASPQGVWPHVLDKMKSLLDRIEREGWYAGASPEHGYTSLQIDLFVYATGIYERREYEKRAEMENCFYRKQLQMVLAALACAYQEPRLPPNFAKLLAFWQQLACDTQERADAMKVEGAARLVLLDAVAVKTANYVLDKGINQE